MTWQLNIYEQYHHLLTTLKIHVVYTRVDFLLNSDTTQKKAVPLTTSEEAHF